MAKHAAEGDGSTVVSVKSKAANKRSAKQDKAGKPSGSTFCTKATVVLVPLLAALVYLATPRPSELLPPFEREPGDTPGSKPISNDFYERTNVWFSSGDENGTMISAWKYLPKDWAGMHGDQLPPVVIMAHGLGGQRDFGLHNTADVFARAGLGVLVFDYRTFGGSDGEPRHWASPSRHLDDWRAAVRYVQGSADTSGWDTSRLVLWGTSYSGGHALVLAAELKDQIKGVVSQVPHLSAPAAAGVSLAFRGILPSLRMLVAGFYDALRARLGLSPVYIRLAGPHQSLAVMALTPEELTSYYAKHPTVKLGGWKNQVLARFVLEASRYSPINHLTNVTAPTLLVAASNDTLCPPEMVAAASRVLGVDVLMFPVDHFALYLTEVWAQSMAQQLSFVCNVTDRLCPRDRNFEITPMVTTIGGRHGEAAAAEAAAEAAVRGAAVEGGGAAAAEGAAAGRGAGQETGAGKQEQEGTEEEEDEYEEDEDDS